jgi:hypothetical protein
MEMLRHPHEGSAEGSTLNLREHSHLPDMHKLFVLPPSAIALGKNLRAAKHVSWYDITVLSGVSHGIEVSQRNDGTSLYVTRGGDVDEQVILLNRLLLAKPQTKTAEVRVLRIPSIVAFSFWLHFKNSSTDLLVPVITNIPQLAMGNIYKVGEFLRAARQIAPHLKVTIPIKRIKDKRTHVRQTGRASRKIKTKTKKRSGL